MKEYYNTYSFIVLYFVNLQFLIITIFRNNKFCDVQFVVGDKNISAHKAILASHSKYFDSMFTGNFKDSTLLEIKNKEITPNSFEQLIDFLYTSQLTINDSNVQVI